eukprot:4008418-Amphidinium_carterae.3
MTVSAGCFSNAFTRDISRRKTAIQPIIQVTLSSVSGAHTGVHAAEITHHCNKLCSIGSGHAT